MRTLLRTSALLAFFLFSSLAEAGSVDKSVSVAPKNGGGISFIVSSAGSIKVNIAAPSAVKARLVGPKGDAATKGPSTSIDLNVEVKEDDVAAGKGWAVILTSPDGAKAAVEAKIKIEHPGNALADKDLDKVLDHGARAAPKIPQGLPPSTPLMPDAASITKIVTAKIPNSKPNVSAVGKDAILRKANALHDSIPRPPAPSTKSAGPPPQGAGNNFGGIPIQVPAGRTYVPIVSIDVSNDDEPSRTCNTSACTIKAGDVLTFTLGPNSDKVAHEAHFVFFDPDVDIAMKVIEWKDDVRKVSVQMPKVGSEHFDKLAAVYLGTPNGQVTSTFFGFKYDPTIVLFLPMDSSSTPKGAYSTTTPPNPEWTYSGPMDNKTKYAVIRGSAIGTSGKDTFFGGVTLKNNWIVKKVEHQGWASSLVPNPQASHTITEVHENSSNAQVVVDWFYDPGTTLQYTLGLKVAGREGTLPY
jgi:hypothetical protein